MPLISVIVPVYNVKAYVGECLESIIKQTIKEIEIIVIDDGSTDGSGDICDLYSEKDKRLKVIHKSNEGVSTARNMGINLATGKWITFIDADDWVEKNMCEVVLETAENCTADIVMWKFSREYKNLGYIPDFIGLDGTCFQGEEITNLQLKLLGRYAGEKQNIFSCLATTYGKLYRTSLIKNNMIIYPNKVANGEDAIFTLYAFEYAKHIIYRDMTLYHYRERKSSVTKAYSEKPIESWKNNRREVKKFCDKHKDDIRFEQAYDIHGVEVLKLLLFTVFAHREGGLYKADKRLKDLVYSPEFKLSFQRVALKCQRNRITWIVILCIRLHLYKCLIFLTKVRINMTYRKEREFFE